MCVCVHSQKEIKTRLFKWAYDVIEKMRRASATHTEQRAELALKKLTFAIVDDHEYIAHVSFSHNFETVHFMFIFIY